MPRVDPLKREEVPELEDVFRIKEQTLGFVPNSALTLARWPDLARSYRQLSAAVASTRYLSTDLMELVFLMASMAGGCRYCQAHSAYVGRSIGIPQAKLDDVWTFESSSLFSDAERAALRLALAAGSHPPMVTDRHFDDLRLYYDDNAIVEVVGVISFAGFMNRWNDTLGTPLEEGPLAVAEEDLRKLGWEAGVHISD